MLSNRVLNVATAVLALSMSFVTVAQPQECIPYNLNVKSDTDVQFDFVFHQSFATEVEVNQGAKSQPVAGTYKLRGGNKTQSVTQTVVLGDGFDLRGNDREVLESLSFSMDQRGGDDVSDHQPVVTSIDRNARTATVSVVLENESFKSKRIPWTVQLAQDDFVKKQIESVPVELVSDPITRVLDARSGLLNEKPITYNSLNASEYLSVVHRSSQCVLDVYAFDKTLKAYVKTELVDGDENVVSIQGPYGSTSVTVKLNQDPEAGTGLQKQLVPELVVLD